MANPLGMDVTEIRRIGNQLITEAANMGAVISRATAQVNTAKAAWKGTDADHFVNDWTQKRSQLSAIQDRIRSLGNEALYQANQQAAISR